MSENANDTLTLNIYSVKDVKTGQFLSLETYLNDLECERAIKLIVNRTPDSLLGQFPEDYELYRLGTLLPSKCIETKLDDPVKICNMSDIIQKKSNN